jgi:hypothetical protein
MPARPTRGFGASLGKREMRRREARFGPIRALVSQDYEARLQVTGRIPTRTSLTPTAWGGQVRQIPHRVAPYSGPERTTSREGTVQQRPSFVPVTTCLASPRSLCRSSGPPPRRSTWLGR